MKVLVTGGSGYVAGHAILDLKAHGYQVATTVRNLAKTATLKSYLGDDVAFFTADLMHDTGWIEAMADVDAIFHIASPLGHEDSNDEQLIVQAVSGVENVFNAAAKAGVKRIVMTSSQAASTPLHGVKNKQLDESLWSDESNPALNAYRLSKLKAERRAWELAKELELDLTTILPGAIFGTVLSENAQSSVSLIERMAKGGFVPKISAEISDVRDVAVLHRLALENDLSIGQRYIVKSSDLTFKEISQILGARSYEIPDWVVKLAARRMPELNALVPMLGRESSHTSLNAQKELNWQPISAVDTILDTQISLNI